MNAFSEIKRSLATAPEDKNLQEKSSFESREDKREAIHGVQEEGLSRVREKFGPEGSQEELGYHGEDHTRGVMERAGKIIEALGGTEDEKEVAKLAAAWHDVVQNALNNPDSGNRLRDRTPPNQDNPEQGNEYKSFKELEKYLEDKNLITIHPDGRKQLRAAILATTPNFAGFGLVTYEGVTDKEHNKIKSVSDNSVGPKIDQPFLEKHLRENSDEPSKIVLAVALADLGTVGMEKGENALKDGDAEYRETRSALQDIYKSYPEDQKEAAKQRISKLLRDESGNQVSDQGILKNLDIKEQAVVLKSMKDWLKHQQGFAEAQRERFYKIIKLVPDDVGNNLKKVFTEFENNIVGMQNRYKAIENKSFHEVAQAMGYKSENLPPAAA